MASKFSLLRKIVSPKIRRGKFVGWYSPSIGVEVHSKSGIIFSPFARRLIRANPNLRRNTFSAFEKIRVSGGEVSKSGNVFLHNLREARGNVGTGFFKLVLGKRNFFLKVIENSKVKEKFNPLSDLAISQHNALIEAKKVITKNKLSDLFMVAEPHFAFVSDKYSFQVTDFYDCKTVVEIQKGSDMVLFEEVRKKGIAFDKGLIVLKQNGFSDLGPHNAFYSPKLGKFILFDLRYN